MKTLRLLLLSVTLGLLCVGCASVEPENASERPWNGQSGWQHGLPSGINQGR